MVALANSYFPGTPSRSGKIQYYVQRRAWQLANLQAKQILTVVRKKLKPHDGEAPDPSIAVNERVMRRYRPRPYNGSLVLFVSAESDYVGVSPALDPRRQWANLAGGTETIFVPGDHESILLRPDVEAFAIKLRESLRKAQGVVAGWPSEEPSTAKNQGMK